MPQRTVSNNKKIDAGDLRRLLRTLWLTAEFGPMTPVIDETVKAYKYQHSLAVVFETGPGVPISSTLTALDIEHTVHVKRPKPKVPTLSKHTKPLPLYEPPLPSESSTVRKVFVPTMYDRFDDFEMLVPYFFRRTLRDLNELHPTRIPGVEGLFLLLLRFLLKPCELTIADVIRNAIIDADGGLVSAPFSMLTWQVKEAFYRELQKLPYAALAYIGLGTVNDDIAFSEEAKYHWLNALAVSLYKDDIVRSRIGVSAGTGSGPGLVRERYPAVKVNVSFSLRDIGLAAKNLAVLVSAPVLVKNKAKAILALRLRGKSKDSIRDTLRFEDDITYNRFINVNYISLSSQEPRDVLVDWEEARDRLFGDQAESAPEPEVMISFQDETDDDVPTATSASVKDVEAEEPSIAQQDKEIPFKHGKDYRSVNLRGEVYTLSSKEAQVIQMLHEAYLNDTPDLGHDKILLDLYGSDSNTKRLVDVFKDKKMYHALIASIRKGTYRLNL